MAYDGFYGGLSTRGSVNEVLNLAIQTKDEVLALKIAVDSDAEQVALDTATVEVLAEQVRDDKLLTDFNTIQTQNNANYVAQAISQVVLEDAPSDGVTYSRRDGQWVDGSATQDFYNINFFWDTVTYAPGNVLAKVYPRINLTRPVLTSCYCRMETVNAQNVVIEMRSTLPGSTWVATCTIPAGQLEGYFTSVTVEALDAAEGLVLSIPAAPTAAPVGLAMSLTWEILPDFTALTLK